jgi:hypothetical protein
MARQRMGMLKILNRSPDKNYLRTNSGVPVTAADTQKDMYHSRYS